MKTFKNFILEAGPGLWANIRAKKARGEKMRKKGAKGAPTKAAMKSAQEDKGSSESWEAGFQRRVIKTTKPEHLEKGYKYRIKGKEKAEITIKLYKTKPDFAEFKKQMKRVAGHEFGG